MNNNRNNDVNPFQNTDDQISITLSEEQVATILDRLEKRAMERIEERLPKKIKEQQERKTRFTYKEAAEVLKISKEALRKRVYRGQITAYLRDTLNPIIMRKELLRYLTEQKGMFEREAVELIDG